MRNTNFDSSIERMKQLMVHGDQDAKLRANVNETVEYKVNGPNGKVYGIVKERQKYYIKESIDGVTFEYIGGSANKSENQYIGYNSAYRNLELKIRSINESLNNGKVFEVLPADTKSEYIIEATQDMRNEIDRQKQIMMGAAKIMNEKSEFISKTKFKDPESFGTATDPKKQGAPFTDTAKASLDKDPNFKATDPKKQGAPFTNAAKSKEDKFDIEKSKGDPSKAGKPFTTDAEDVLGDSVATKKPKGGKVIKITETQLAKVRRYMAEGIYDDDDEFGIPSDVEDESFDDIPELSPYKARSSVAPKSVTIDSDEDDYTLPTNEIGDDLDLDLDDDDEDMIGDVDFPIPSRVRYIGNNENARRIGTFDYVGKAPGGKSYIAYTTSMGEYKELNSPVPTSDLELVGINESYDNALAEGLWDSMKAIGSVGKKIGGDAKGKVGDTYNKAANAVSNTYNKAAGAVKDYGTGLSQTYNKSMQNTSTEKVQQLANNLRAEIENLNKRTVAGGGQPLNMNSVIATISNQLRGGKGVDTSKYRAESVEDDALIAEITEAVLNSFGDHPSYQKAAFTTPSDKGTPYGQKIGNSAPFTKSVKQKVGEGEIAQGADSVMRGKTPQGKPNLGKEGDKAPFNKSTGQSKTKIANGTPVSNGETPASKPSLGKKGDTEPFTKKVTKESVLNKISESIINDFKKKI